MPHCTWWLFLGRDWECTMSRTSAFYSFDFCIIIWVFHSMTIYFKTLILHRNPSVGIIEERWWNSQHFFPHSFLKPLKPRFHVGITHSPLPAETQAPIWGLDLVTEEPVTKRQTWTNCCIEHFIPQKILSPCVLRVAQTLQIQGQRK